MTDRIQFAPGHPLAPIESDKIAAADLARFMNKVNKTNTCWLWLGYIRPSGYGTFSVGGRSGVTVYAHRFSYLSVFGKIPEGLDLDHLCRVRNCVNPSHLEPVSRLENTMRGNGPRVWRDKNLSKTHCVNGHEFSEMNTQRFSYKGIARRRCRRCSADRAAACRARKMEIANAN